MAMVTMRAMVRAVRAVRVAGDEEGYVQRGERNGDGDGEDDSNGDGDSNVDGNGNGDSNKEG